MSGALKKNFGGLKRRPFLTPVWLFALAGIIVTCLVVWIWSTADSTTVIVIRHTEQEKGDQPAPPLTAAGHARAALLARMFGGGDAPGSITAIYVAESAPARATAAALAGRLGLTPIIVAGDDPRALAQAVLRDHAGGRVLVVGQSETLPDIVAALSGVNPIPAMAESEYGTIYIVTVPRLGRPNLLRLSY
jgi:hypothetical protein